ncbi:MAG TPA: amino acid adenylation domain-containing protein, partial [Longimicrobium sp.]|nr:amino acid adenylation domain-containing protein [Longimicrobium sp.]
MDTQHLSNAERLALLKLARATAPMQAPATLPPVEPAPREGRVPLSFAQQRLWFLEQMGGVGSAYHIPTRLRLRGELDRAALARALDRIVERHEALRTTFAQVDGVPEQRIAPADAGFQLAEHDLNGVADAAAELGRVAAREARAPFDLERGPLIRGRLVRLAADDHLLLLTLHHIVSDGWSMGVLTRELSTLYDAFRRGEPDPLPPLEVQYADYAIWQRRWVEGPVLREQAEYWTQTLAGAPELLELPTDHPRPAERDHAGASLPVELDEALTAGLKALSRRHGATLFMTLLAGWAAVLGRLSGQDDVVVGTPTANRGRREVEGLIGFFVNTLALRVDLSGAPTVAELLERVKARALGAQQHQDIPFEQVVERVDPARSLAHHPLFQVMFTWQNAPGRRPEGPGLAQAPLERPEHATAEFDLTLTLSERGGKIAGSVEYATSLFARETVERWVGYLRRVLEEMAADESRPVERLALMPPSERQRVVEEWNRTAAAYPESCIHELFEAQARRAPDAAAVVFEDEQLTRAELNRRANRLAHHLRSLGVGPDVRVGICVERSPEMVVGLLAVLKAGGAYVPLDPSYPDDRLRYMLVDSAPAAVLTQAHLGGRMRALVAEAAAQAATGGGKEAGVPLLRLDADAGAWAHRPETDPPRAGLLPAHPAYVIYTSGSTGAPKGVVVEHRSVCGQLAAVRGAFGTTANDRVLQFVSVTFDVSVEEIFGALLGGAAVVLRDDGWVEGARAFWERCERHRVTLVDLPTRFWQLLLDDPAAAVPACLRLLVIGGEAVEPGALREWFGRAGHRPRLLNAYGPTETTINATLQEVPDDPGAWRAVGRPMANTRVYVLDARGEPVPVGVAGELCIGGAGVARGYLGRAELTAERFVADPFGPQPGARLYRTGDLVRWRADGALEYLGRNDRQVKIRGFRIEPGEIEARLLEHAGVREAAVVTREDAPGEKRLVAYWVGEAAGAEALRAHLRERLPEYMVPAAYVRLEQWPLTPSGKLDHRALPAPEGDAYAAGEYEAPVGETEQVLAGIWAEVLRVPRVGRHDNFFELGGHSLLVVQVIARLRRRGLHADVRTVFVAPTLAALAAELAVESPEVEVPANGIPAGCERITPEMLPLVTLDQAQIDAVVAGVPGGAANVQDIYPLARLQEGVLFHHLMSTEGDPYLSAILYGFESRERLDRYLDAFQAVVDRHDILRTSVAWEGLPEPVQVVWRKATLEVEEVALDPAAGAAVEQLRARFDPRHYRIDVRRAPLVRARIAHDPVDGRWLLLLLDHHLSGDHTGKEVMESEIEAFVAGRADTLPEPLPFRDYVARSRLGVSEEEHRAFFTELLGDVDEPTAPFGLLDVRGDGSGIAVARLRVDGGLAGRLRERARALGASAASVFHVAWAQVLARTSGRDDVVFGTVLVGRMHGGEGADRVMGPFINTLPIRLRVGEIGAEAGVRQAHALLAKLLRHEHASLALAQRCSAVDPSAPLFTSLLSYRHSGRKARPDAPAATPGAAPGGMRAIHGKERTNYPVDLLVDDLGAGGFRLTAQVAGAVEAERVCALMHRALEGLAEALERAPRQPLRTLPVLPASEWRRVVEEWNRTEAAYPAESCIHELFEAQVRRTPGATALVSADARLTYAELNGRANRLAHHLRALGVGPEARVGICVERSPEMVVGLLGVFKAGGAYLPLDPDYPPERLGYMLAD